jgi:hypothetical protein
VAFTVAKLLLTAERQAQLTAALANLTVGDPIAVCVTEAEAAVARFTTGYTLTAADTDQFCRILALYHIYSLTGVVPPDIAKNYSNAIEELRAIAAGERPNLPVADPTGAGTGTWGAQANIFTRSTIP